MATESEKPTMSHSTPWEVRVQDHPGSSADEVNQEPDWEANHSHRIGFVNQDDRRPGLTHPREEYAEEIEDARKQLEEMRSKVDMGELVNFRDIIQSQRDFHIKYPEERPLGWRYVLNTTEDWVKNKEPWPANLQQHQRQEPEEAKTKKDKNQETGGGRGAQPGQAVLRESMPEFEWRADNKEKHQEARHVDSESGEKERRHEGATGNEQTGSANVHFTPQELSLLHSLEHDKDVVSQFKQHDGKGKSPQTHNRTSIAIDEQDQYTPDNWLPRCPDLIRIGGKHPMNAEPPLSRLFDGGLITPNELHYVRNHGPVPRLMWEFHKLDIEYGGRKLSLSMNELKSRYRESVINIPITMACTGNRRKELNLIRKSKGLNNGAATVGTAYWKGPLLRDVLISAGVPKEFGKRKNPKTKGMRHWVNFAGADMPSEGPYETSIPFDYIMDPANDVILAMEMNDLPLPADYGYPVRVMIPGYIGGRCVKWLRRVWITSEENKSYYHTWDNRLMPSFVTEKDGRFAEALFHNPSTACYENNLNSVIAKPAQGETIALSDVECGKNYRLAGFAYDGGGREVQRVEVSLDGGESWLYATREFPDSPLRHGNKFWAWIHWHLDVNISHLVQAKSIAVRAFNASKMTQPEKPTWNLLGMMNNSWYIVKPEILTSRGQGPAIAFHHPTEAGAAAGGWMKPSMEVLMQEAKQQGSAPEKQFTREEIEKHNKLEDCWLVIDNKVYDATTVLNWHPGGRAAILAHAGKCHQETTNEFVSIHDDFAWKKLHECILGRVTNKTANFIRESAEAAAKEEAEQSQDQKDLALQRRRWIPVKLVNRRQVSPDTNTYTFQLPEGKTVLGLGTCQHLQIGFHLRDKMLIRQYTPTRPILPAQDSQGSQGRGDESLGKHDHKLPKQHVHTSAHLHQDKQHTSQQSKTAEEVANCSLMDGQSGTFDLTVKTYFPSPYQPGGALSNILDCLPLGSEVEIRGPTGDIIYHGNGHFSIEGRDRHFSRVSLVLGGSGITPGYALMARILMTPGDRTEIRVVDANRTEHDILLKQELDILEEKSDGQMKICHVLSQAGEGWEGERGKVDAGILKRCLFKPAHNNVALLCGPPGLIQGVVLPALIGYVSATIPHCLKTPL
ncbi:unnamed protein product [Sordaria macrospora k-hell]|uniref:Nitrate reductase [NADPH] n=1 Tax=Sordaria macrospora (strain ATCC MYA-333 / DSM 997 / K(L3346) / K-hell) TaxID=771870 RepID=F7W5I7_SORMK|nr:uncharacterized protein SMAC_07620 [Sordaria macrospora k-hell]CCC12775.1 unnamed protein product [Sordaria macrospora k-hell]